MAERDNPSSRDCPVQPWSIVRRYINRSWDLENCPHHTIVGLTGSGKTYLARHGLLELCKYDRVMIIDTKGADKTISVIGRPVKKIPRQTWFGLRQKRRPYEQWYRLILPPRVEMGRDIVGEALERAYDEGEWIIYIDELRDLAPLTTRDISMRLNSTVSMIYTKGRSQHTGIIASTQTPTNIISDAYTQASYAWIGHVRDEARQKRLLEIGGLSKKELPYVSSLVPREWLLTAESGRTIVKTKVVV